MTTVMTRLYANQYSAKAVQNRLLRQGFPRNLCWVLSGSDDAGRAKVLAKLREVGVSEDTVSAYGGAMNDDTGLLVVQANYRPLNAKRIARETIAESAPMDMGGVAEDCTVKEPRDHAPSILKSHPRFLTIDPELVDGVGGHVTRTFGFPILLPSPKRESAIKGGQLMTGDWAPLLSHKPRKSAVMSGGRHMSGSNLISKRKRGSSVIRGGDLPLSRALGWATISSR